MLTDFSLHIPISTSPPLLPHSRGLWYGQFTAFLTIWFLRSYILKMSKNSNDCFYYFLFKEGLTRFKQSFNLNFFYKLRNACHVWLKPVLWFWKKIFENIKVYSQTYRRTDKETDRQREPVKKEPEELT